MSNARYPLDALLRLRGQIVREHQQRLAERLASAREAESVAARAHQELAVARRAVEERRAELFGSARTVADDMQRATRWLSRLRDRVDSCGERCRRAELALASCRTEVARARAALAHAQAELESVERDKSRWDRERMRRERQRAETELEDLALARRLRSGPGAKE